MKLSEIITKYTPLGWHFEEDVLLDRYWTFKSPRMERRNGFALGVGLDDDVDEDKMLQAESRAVILNKYHVKITDSFQSVKNDIWNQLVILDRKGLPVPEEIDVKFTLKLK